ncbi:MAG: hypothetical protein WDO71_19440 [Bacteroidota bacterium]
MAKLKVITESGGNYQAQGEGLFDEQAEEQYEETCKVILKYGKQN